MPYGGYKKSGNHAAFKLDWSGHDRCRAPVVSLSALWREARDGDFGRVACVVPDLEGGQERVPRVCERFVVADHQAAGNRSDSDCALE